MHALSFCACYWHVVKIFYCGSVLKEIVSKIISAECQVVGKNYREKMLAFFLPCELSAL